jgi:phage baseplate assembly protein W
MDLDHHGGGAVEGWPHVVQSIEAILKTRMNTRVFRREFGSDVSQMVDMPANDANVIALYVAVAEAIDRWEPRFSLTDTSLSLRADGVMTLQLEGSYLPNAHLGDAEIVSDEKQIIRVQGTRVDNWSLAK